MNFHVFIYPSRLKLFFSDDTSAVEHVFTGSESNTKLRSIITGRMEKVTWKSSIDASGSHRIR